MNIIFRIRGFICRFIKRINLPLLAVLKFGAYFMLFHYVAGLEGFQAGLKINSLMVQIILAVIATILPNRHGIFLAIVMLLGNIWQITQIGTAVAGILFLFVYIMTARLFPDQVYMLALVPLCLHYKLYLVLPAFAGMYIGVIAIVPMIAGVIVSILMGLLPEFMALVMPEKIDAIPQMLSNVFKYAFDQVIHNETLLFLMILFTVVITLIYLLQKIEVNYGSYFAITAGLVLGVLTIIMARSSFEIAEPNSEIIKQAVVAWVIMLFLEFMHKALDYEATERLSFEDDEYEYHVTLIPKIYGGKKKKKKPADEPIGEESESNLVPMQEEQEEPPYEEPGNYSEYYDEGSTQVIPDTTMEQTIRVDAVEEEPQPSFMEEAAQEEANEPEPEEEPAEEPEEELPPIESVFSQSVQQERKESFFAEQQRSLARQRENEQAEKKSETPKVSDVPNGLDSFFEEE